MTTIAWAWNRSTLDDMVLAQGPSVTYAATFVKSLLTHITTTPVGEVHADGELALTWRQAQRGIINIAFHDDGVATYAAWLVKSRQTHKGKFTVESTVPESILAIIQHICFTKDCI